MGTLPEVYDVCLAIDRVVFADLSRGVALEDALAVMCQTLEQQSPGMFCSILVSKQDGKHLFHAAAPSLPESYTQAINGLAIGPNAGSCGTAAYRREAVIVSDIANDPLWAGYRDLALKHGLRACWSTPVTSGDGTVLGTFAVYYREARLPTDRERQIIKWATPLVAMTIERKQAEESICKQREELQMILDAAPAMIWYKDKENRILRANRAAAESVGMQVREMVGRSTYDLYPAEAAKYHMDDLEVVHTGKPKIGIHELFQTKLGEKRWVMTDKLPYRDNDGNIIGVVVFARDVTKQHDTETALREAEVRYRTLVEHLPGVIYIAEYGPQGRWFFVSPQIQKLLGFSPEEWIDNPAAWASQLHPDDRDRVVAEELASSEKGESFVSEYRMFTRDDRVVWVRDECTLMPGTTGTPHIMQGVLLDITESKKTLGTLSDVKERLSMALKASGISLWDCDVISGKVYLSEGWSVLLGEEPMETQTTVEALLELTRPDDRERVWKVLLENVKGLTPSYREEHRVRGRNGDWIWIESTGRVVERDKNGRALRMIGTNVNVTERKRIEEDLRVQKAFLEQLIDSAPEAVSIVDTQRAVRRVNREFMSIFGYSAEQAMGRDLDELILPPEKKEEGYWFDEQARKGLAVSLDTFRMRKNGTRVPVSALISPIYDASQHVGNYCIYRDISDRKRMETERAVIAEISHGVNETANLDELLNLIHRSLKKVVYAENCFIALHDRNTGTFSLPFFVDKYDTPPAPARNVKSCMAYVFRTGRPQLIPDHVAAELAIQGQIEIVGTNAPSWLGVPLKSPSETIGVLVVQHYEKRDAYTQRDVEFLSSVADQIAIAIERKRAEEALRNSEMRVLSAQKMEAVGRLAGGIAHDFNNLLTVINGHLELLQEQSAAGDPRTRMIEQAQKAADKAAALTRQLLAFSRMQVLQPKIINLNAVVTEISKLLSPLLGVNTELSLVFDRNLGSVKADPGQIEQVILNLAVNARDAMPAGGKLAVETANVELNSEFASLHPPLTPGRYVLLAVSDTGKGMDAETQERIFEPFFTTKEKGKGTGLGLATVYGIVKQSSGYILVDSKPGKGTRFSIYLPLVEEPAEPLKPANASSKLLEGTETILLVEDENDVREVAREFLKQMGYTVIEAKNGQEALEIARDYPQHIHVLLTDIVMPGISGLELGAELAAARPEVKVVYMSGYSQSSMFEQLTIAPNAILLQKPFSRDSLARVIREAINGR